MGRCRAACSDHFPCDLKEKISSFAMLDRAAATHYLRAWGYSELLPDDPLCLVPCTWRVRDGDEAMDRMNPISWNAMSFSEILCDRTRDRNIARLISLQGTDV